MKVIDHGYAGPDQTAYALMGEMALALSETETDLTCEIFYNKNWRQLELILVDHELLCGHESYKDEIESDDDGVAIPEIKVWVEDTTAMVKFHDRYDVSDKVQRTFDLNVPESLDGLRAVLIGTMDRFRSALRVKVRK